MWTRGRPGGEGGIRTHGAFAHRFSRAAPSTTRTPLRARGYQRAPLALVRRAWHLAEIWSDLRATQAIQRIAARRAPDAQMAVAPRVVERRRGGVGALPLTT